MDKQKVLIIIFAVCIVAAGAITYYSMTGGGAQVQQIPDRQEWFICTACKQVFSMTAQEYAEIMKGTQTMGPAPIQCPHCKKTGAASACKCPQCGHVFVLERKINDYADRCPKCKFSEYEQKLKEQQGG